MKKNISLLSVLIIGLVFSQNMVDTSTDLDTIYPSDTAILYKRGIISTNLNEYNITFSPKGDMMLYTIANNTLANRFYTIFLTEKKQGKWTAPQIASFSGEFSDADPFFDPSGKKVYFISTRPVFYNSFKTDFDIWYVDYENGKFGSPQHLGSDVNSQNDELYPTISENGNLFFSVENGVNDYDLMVSKYENDNFLKPVSLGDSINTVKTEFDAFVAPDESYVIYTGMNYDENYGSGDLYISYRKKGYWTKGKNLGNNINTVHMEQCPMVSSDGRFLFFTSFRDSMPFKKIGAMTTEEYLERLNSPLNGLGNIYWVSLKKYFKALKSGY